MKIKKSIYTLYFALCVLPFVFFNVAHSGDDPVKTIQTKYRSIDTLRADFVQSTYVAVLDTTIREPGAFAMKKPGMLRIEYTGEHPKKYISDGKKLWIVDAELDQVETYGVSNNFVPKEALEFLKGFGEMEKLFTVTDWQPKKRLNDHVYLRLTPKNGKAQYKQLECEFGPDAILKTMAIHNKSGNISTYVFNNVRLNVSIGDETFKFGGLK